jgi:hypothetical protein
MQTKVGRSLKSTCHKIADSKSRDIMIVVVFNNNTGLSYITVVT